MQPIPSHPFSEPKRVGSIDVWRNPQGWWCRNVKDVAAAWSPMSPQLIALAKRYAAVSDTLQQGKKRWQSIR